MAGSDRQAVQIKCEQIINHLDTSEIYILEIKQYFENNIDKYVKMILREGNPPEHVREAAEKQARERYDKFLKALDIMIQYNELYRTVVRGFRREL